MSDYDRKRSYEMGELIYGRVSSKGTARAGEKKKTSGSGRHQPENKRLGLVRRKVECT